MKRILAVLVACCGLAAIPVASATAHRSAKMSQPNIVALAASSPQLSTLVTLVKSAGLVKALSGSTKLTVFAPTNAAFAKVPKATLNKLAHNKKLLAAVLEYHVVKGALTAAQIEKKTSLNTLEGASLAVKVKSGSVYINQAKVITPNLQASNGIVHVINSVLTPPAAG
jgi:uncharacterized surface protein with fasciclin (FAS1) repeats